MRAGDGPPEKKRSWAQAAALFLILVPSLALYFTATGGQDEATWFLLSLVASGMFLAMWSS